MELREFEEQVFALRHRVFRFARRLLADEQEAEDAMQEIYLKLWRMREKLPGYRSVEALTLKMTRNHCLDVLKARKPEFSLEVKHSATSGMSEPDKELEASDLHKHLRKFIGRLPEQQRTVIQLRDIEGCSFEEMEDITGQNKNALRVNLSRARKTIREQLKEIYAYGT